MRVVAAAALAAALGAPAAAPAAEVRGADFAGRWVAPDAELTIRFASLPDPGEARLAFVDGVSDVTALFRHVLAGEYVYTGRELPLAPGERELKVFLVKDGQWTQLAAFPLRVTTAAGFERFALRPRLDVTAKGQLDQNRTGDAPPLGRTNYQDAVFQGGFALEASRGGLALASSFNAAGSSVQTEALRYAALGEEAPKADLSDYTVSAQSGGTHIQVGHLSYGSNPLLLMSYGSRGVAVRQALGERVDVSLGAMNGTGIVGYENFVGLEDAEHQVRGGALGVELLERKGALRAEVQYVDASLRSQLPFNAGTIPDAERISGAGLRLAGASESGRLRGDLVLARVRHEAAPDPFLEQGQTLTEIRPVTKNARAIDLSYELVRAEPGAGARFPFGLTLLLHHDRVDPLFKSVGTGLASDQRLNRIGFAAQLGPVQAQASTSRRDDNLENIPTLLKTRTDADALAVNLPLAQLWPLDGGAPRAWVPALSYRYESSHQRAVNVPIAALSGFAPTHLPDQMSRAHGAGVNWQGAQWQLAYSYLLATQDNRQVGREAADFHNTGHTVQAGYRFTPAFGVTAGLGRTNNYANERNLSTYSTTHELGFDWQFAERWSVSAAHSQTRGFDSQRLADSRGWNSNAQLAYRFRLSAFGLERQGQAFLRYVSTRNFNRDNVFGFQAEGHVWMVQSGITVSLF